MRRVILIGHILALLLISCGKSSDSEVDSASSNLENSKWLIDLGNNCGYGLNFTAGSKYSQSSLCANFAGTQANIQVQTGIYSLNEAAKTIGFTPEKSTCPIKTASSGTYNLSGGHFILTIGGKVFAFAPNTAGVATATITMGCFNDDGTFVAGQLN